jgi:hypothetical protein
MFLFTEVMCWVTLTLSTVPEPRATTCNLPVKLDWKVPCCAFSVPPNHSAPRMLLLSHWSRRRSSEVGGVAAGTTVTELVYRHQLKPVIQTGATVMDRLFGPGNESVVTQDVDGDES